jgi:hypothetical protein
MEKVNQPTPESLVRRIQAYICYTEKDKEFAQRLVSILVEHGISVWFAPTSIPRGMLWGKRINQGLCESDCVIVLLSAASAASEWVEIETYTAIALERQGLIQRIIPLYLEPCDAPPLLTAYQGIHVGDDESSAIAQLIETLDSLRTTTDLG